MGKAAAGTLKLRKSTCCLAQVISQNISGCKGGARICNIVRTGTCGQHNIDTDTRRCRNGKRIFNSLRTHTCAAHVIARLTESIRYDLAARRTSKLNPMRIIAVNDYRLTRIKQTHKITEGLLDIFKRSIVIKVIRFDIGDDNHIGSKVHKRTVGLIRLTYKVIA